jgi:hypothetical protein
MNPNRLALVIVGGAVAVGFDVLACSGPGAMARIEEAERLGYWLAGASALLCGLGVVVHQLRGGGLGLRMGVVVLATIQPGWWLSARGGDCGAMRTIGAWTGLALALVVTAIAVVLALRKLKRVAP